MVVCVCVWGGVLLIMTGYDYRNMYRKCRMHSTNISGLGLNITMWQQSLSTPNFDSLSNLHPRIQCCYCYCCLSFFLHFCMYFIDTKSILIYFFVINLIIRVYFILSKTILTYSIVVCFDVHYTCFYNHLYVFY